MPWWVSPLVRMTTAPYRGDPSVDPRIARWLRRRQDEGWLVRAAGPRNYTAWRNAEAVRNGAPVIILPNVDFPFTQDERNVAVLRDIVVAEFRTRPGHPEPGDETLRRLLTVLASALFPNHTIDDRHLERLLHRIEKKTADAMLGRR